MRRQRPSRRVERGRQPPNVHSQHDRRVGWVRPSIRAAPPLSPTAVLPPLDLPVSRPRPPIPPDRKGCSGCPPPLSLSPGSPRRGYVLLRNHPQEPPLFLKGRALWLYRTST